ncbi:MAG: S8 family serine peptidase [Muribaculaceae bacterium]|nr:S8 family serine peptidase [Muribaculaceae bacterium]
MNIFKALPTLGIFLSVFPAMLAETNTDTSNYPLLRVPRMKGIRTLPPRRIQLFNDLSRQTLNVDEAHRGLRRSEEIIPFTGKGVVIGIVDCGIDPNHPAFIDPVTGDSRVGLYVTTTSMYENGANELEYNAYYPAMNGLSTNMVIDQSANGHGTHTSATAGGSMTGLPYYGIAPEATFVMTSVGDYIYEDEVHFGITNAIDYARQHNMPCVTSLSLGSCGGMHDGSGAMSNLLAEELDDNGQIVCFAAGNDGLNRVSIYKNFDTDPMPLKTAFGTGNWGGKPNGISCFLVSKQDDIQIALTLIQTSTNTEKEIAVSPYFSLDNIPEQGIEISSSLPELAYHVNPQNTVLGLVKHIGNDGNIGIEVIGALDWIDEEKDFTIGIIVNSPQGGELRGFADFSSLFCSYGLDGYTAGAADQSISDYCTSPYVISVGGTVEREGYTDINGNYVKTDTESFGIIHAAGITSSYGTVPEKLPHAMASSIDVISATPDYSTMPRVAMVTHNDKNWYYAAESGTSMATPAVAGVIALWLQANPQLTRDDILEVMNATTSSDYATDRSQYGVPDAYKGLKYILEKASLDKTYLTQDRSNVPLQLMVKYLDRNVIECVVPFPTEGGTYILYSVDGTELIRGSFTGPTFTISHTSSPNITIIKALTPQGSAYRTIK